MNKLLLNTYMKVQTVSGKAQKVLHDKTGDFVMDHAVVAAIVVAVGAISITLLTQFLKSDMAPSLSDKVLSFFN